jgi:FtsP/CotA-like multicopper oxidase with cupredoxin domain
VQCNSSSLIGRRAFLQLSGCAALSPFAFAGESRGYVLCIRKSEIELAPHNAEHNRNIITTTYNGQFPGPVLRAAVGQRVCVDVLNATDTPERIHWQGQEVADSVIPPRSRRRIEFTPGRAGLYLYHSEVVAGSDLGAGLYSAQAGVLLVGPVPRESLVVLKGLQPCMRRTSRGCEVGYAAVTVNGLLPGPLRANVGEHVALNVLNAGATETYQLELPGHDFEVTALDGNPLPAPWRVESLRVCPGERVTAHVVINQATRWVVRETDQAPAAFDGVNSIGPVNTLPLVLTRHSAARSGLNRWSVNRPGFRVTAGERYRLQIHNISDEVIPLHLRRHRLRINGVLKDIAVIGPQQRVDVDFQADGRGPALLHSTRQLQSDFGLRTLIDYT